MKKRILSLLMALCLAMTLLPATALATGGTGKTIYVNASSTSDSPDGTEGNPYTDLQTAVEAAEPGDTIKLLSGCTLSSQLTIAEAITLDGGNQTITATGLTGTAPNTAGILVTAGATIQNVKVSGPNSTTSGWDEGEFGIKLYQATGATLTDVSVTAANAGIQVNGGSVTMTGTINVSGNEFGGIELCHGGSLDLSAATLVSTDEAKDCPVLWNDDTKGTLTQNSNQPLAVRAQGEDKDHYYIDANRTILSQLTTDIGEKTFIAGGDWVEFTFSTVANGDAGTQVYGGSDFGVQYEDKIAALEYKSGDQWIDMKGQNFGGSDGFPMASATSTFRVKFTEDAAGSYTFTAAMKTVGTDVVLCSIEVPFTVERQSSPVIIVPDTNPGTGTGNTGSQTETVTNPDGSTTETVTKPDGTVTETTERTDGSTSVVETKPDGTVTTINTDAAGNKTETVASTDGTSTTTVSQVDGSASTTTVDVAGQVTAEVTLSETVVSAPAESGETVALPMPSVPVTTDAASAPVVTVSLPTGTTAKVEVPVENVTAGTVAVLVNADGTEEVVKTSLTTENGVALTVEDGATVKIVDNSVDFDDVSDAYWGADAVDFATSRELFSGTSETTFEPETAMTRAMIVTVLARYEGVDTNLGETWYEAGARWAVENGISDGSNLDQALTREQLATMLYRYMGEPAANGDLTGFSDADSVSGYAADAMTWAVENGLIGGMGDGTLNPQGPATRAQVATILARFVALNA